jgi:hypothetical protein
MRSVHVIILTVAIDSRLTSWSTRVIYNAQPSEKMVWQEEEGDSGANATTAHANSSGPTPTPADCDIVAFSCQRYAEQSSF